MFAEIDDVVTDSLFANYDISDRSKLLPFITTLPPMMKIQSLALTFGIAVGSTISLGAFTPARSVTLQNGNFTPTNVTQSAYLGNTATSGGLVVTVPGWSFPAQIATASGRNSNNGYNFIAPFGDTLLRNFANNGITATRAIALNKTGNGNAVNLYSGSTPIASPPGTGANWYIAADGAFQQGAIEQTLTGLTAGQSYDVTFYQAAGQQAGFTGATTDKWQVSLGTNSKLSTVINLPSEGNVTGWTKQTLSLKANSTSEVLSFLAVGTPTGLPPFALLAGVDVQPTAVPEPLTFLGTLTALGLGVRIKSRLNKNK
jgi:hypothetical protein